MEGGNSSIAIWNGPIDITTPDTHVGLGSITVSPVLNILNEIPFDEEIRRYSKFRV